MDWRERFWSKVDKTAGDNACWIWNGYRRKRGLPYGEIRVNRKTVPAHRLSWQLQNGDIPNGLCVLHSCDVPMCVNPSHLWLGTNIDNMKDRDAKGRQASGDRQGLRVHPESRPRGLRHGTHTHPETVRRCEYHNMAKLTRIQVDNILRQYADGGTSYRKLAKQYGVVQSTIGIIIKGTGWRMSGAAE